MTILQKVRRIRDEHFHEIRPSEKEFVEDVYDGLDGLPTDTGDEDITDYLTPRQIEWVNDICLYLGISNGD